MGYVRQVCGATKAINCCHNHLVKDKNSTHVPHTTESVMVRYCDESLCWTAGGWVPVTWMSARVMSSVPHPVGGRRTYGWLLLQLEVETMRMGIKHGKRFWNKNVSLKIGIYTSCLFGIIHFLTKSLCWPTGTHTCTFLRGYHRCEFVKY